MVKGVGIKTVPAYNINKFRSPGVHFHPKAAVANLAAIILEYDEGKDEVYAVGVAGTNQFEQFFKIYKKELREEYGSSRKAKEEVEKTVVMKLEEYTADTIKC